MNESAQAPKSINDLHEKEYIEVLKNTLEVPKYLVSLIVFFATATAAISRLKSSPALLLEKALFVAAMLLTFVAMLGGFRVVTHVLNEMTNPYDDPANTRSKRFTALRRGPYSEFVKWSLVPLLAWMVCLCVIVFT